MSGNLSNNLLQQAENKVESQLEPGTRDNYMKIVVAGLHASLDKGPDGLMASLANSKDPISDAAKGAVSLVVVLRQQAKGVMPMKAFVPAAMTLMLKALDFIDRSKIAKVGQPELVRATHIFTDTVFSLAGITKQGLAHVAGKVHAITQDPAAMEKINLKAGITRHPMAATPTPIPGPPGLINRGAGAG